MHEQKEIAVLYHGKCPDGFGGAYAAWKKFNDSAEYIPVKYGEPLPEGLEDKDIYIVDFCYEDPAILSVLKAHTKKVVVLDHHASSRENVESFPEHVFDNDRSGSTIAWTYFHPEAPMPNLLKYLEDGDLYKYSLPETRDVFSYLLVLPYDFQEWDSLVQTLEDDAARTEFLKKASIYSEYFKLLGDLCVEGAKKVSFEGYECLFANSHPAMTMKSYVGNELAKKFPPFALVVSAHPEGFGVSIRGNGSVDVSKIAEKYGGGGHHNAAGFLIPNNSEMPWKENGD
jgi:oligoribonuclease NrnB/cAMP/cGMP phosphodiesterase (DHH superfamily)